MKTVIGLSLLLAALPCFVGAITCDIEPEQRWVNVNYTIWAEKGAERAHFNANRIVTVPYNASYLDMMKIAELADERYEFVAIENYTNHRVYITTINGMQENKAGFIFWMIYKLPGPPDPAVKPENQYFIPKTVDHFYVEDGDNVLFWLHYFNYLVEEH